MGLRHFQRIGDDVFKNDSASGNANMSVFLSFIGTSYPIPVWKIK